MCAKRLHGFPPNAAGAAAANRPILPKIQDRADGECSPAANWSKRARRGPEGERARTAVDRCI